MLAAEPINLNPAVEQEETEETETESGGKQLRHAQQIAEIAFFVSAARPSS
jgi:hypothetical protein